VDDQKMKTLELGEIKGPLLLFGGVYSNLEALLEMKQLAGERGLLPSQVICTGDVIGYCANPNEVLKEVMDWGIHCIAGNVEIQLREGETDCGCDFDDGSRCDVFSRQWYPFAQQRLVRTELDWLKDLPEWVKFTLGNTEFGVVHGSYEHTSQFIFDSTQWSEKRRQLDLMQVDGIIAGHCGLPFSNTQDGKHWINPGVIGIPANDGTTRVWYATLEEVDGAISWEHHSFEYDHRTAAGKMRQNQLPEAYAKTLETGIWDNCEILPEAETNLQGVPIDF
jgi:predicted phosphodiesterase